LLRCGDVRDGSTGEQLKLSITRPLTPPIADTGADIADGR
jgi:hypothetical protein